MMLGLKELFIPYATRAGGMIVLFIINFSNRSFSCHIGCVFTSTIVSLNIPEGVLFTDFVKRLKNDWCFHE